MIRSLALLGLVSGTAAVAQPPPPAPPPADPTWASTEGPAWNSYACPDGRVVFTAHLGGPRGLFYSDETGEVATALERTGDDARWVGDRVVERSEPERRKRVTVDGAPYGGGPCAYDQRATIRERVGGLPGVWIADARLNPKPERVGLPVPGGMEREGYRQALFVGSDRVRVEASDVEASQRFPGAESGRALLGLRLAPAAYEALHALQGRHAAQPLALLVDGVLVAEVEVPDRLAPNRVLAVGGLDDARLDRLRQSLGL